MSEELPYGEAGVRFDGRLFIQDTYVRTVVAARYLRNQLVRAKKFKCGVSTGSFLRDDGFFSYFMLLVDVTRDSLELGEDIDPDHVHLLEQIDRWNTAVVGDDITMDTMLKGVSLFEQYGRALMSTQVVRKFTS